MKVLHSKKHGESSAISYVTALLVFYVYIIQGTFTCRKRYPPKNVIQAYPQDTLCFFVGC